MKPAFIKRRYFNQLQNDMKDWVRSGWVSEEGAKQILVAHEPPDSRFNLSMIIGMFGAILLGFAALSFVGANWQEMSNFSRVLLLFSLMWAVFGAGWLFEHKNYHSLKEAAYLLGGVLFGVNIALIAQIYHIDRHPPDGFMLWGAGMLLIAGALESRAALGASFLIIAFWTGMESNWISGYHLNLSIHWAFLLLWGLATFLALKLKSHTSYHLSILSMGLWLLFSLFILTQNHNMSSFTAVSLIMLVMVMVTLIALLYSKKDSLEIDAQISNITVGYGVATMALLPLFIQILVGNRLFRYVGRSSFNAESYSGVSLLLFILPIIVIIGFLLQRHYVLGRLKQLDFVFFGVISAWSALFIIGLTLDMPTLISFLSHAGLFRVLMLSIAIWLVSFGFEMDSPKIVNLGLFSFGVEVLYIYAKLFGSLMDTSLFFLFGGVVLIGLAFGLEKMRRNLAGNNLKGGSS